MESLTMIEGVFYSDDTDIVTFKHPNGSVEIFVSPCCENGPATAAANGQLLFLGAFMAPKHQREALIGCLTERFARDCSRWGRRKATTLMISDLAGTISPATGMTIRRIAGYALKELGLRTVVKYFWG